MKKYTKHGNFALVEKKDGLYIIELHLWQMKTFEVIKSAKRDVIRVVKSWNLI